MRLLRHCTAAVLALVTASGLSAQTPALPPGATEYTVFLGGVAIGREQVRVARAGTNWLITGTGQVGPPLNLVIDRFELEYTADWQPTRLHASVRQGNNRLLITTSFGVTTATNEITQNSVTNSKTDQISARSIVLPNMFYASY